MCTLFFSYKLLRDYPLVLISNRDEYYDRPTLPLDFWRESPDILGGRDLKDGGTWLGMDKRMRLGFLTNIMNPLARKEDARSRGHLVGDYLRGREKPLDYLKKIRSSGRDYNGFNLILGDGESLFYYSNVLDIIKKITPGIYGLSNRFLDTPWAKVTGGKKRMGFILSGENADFREDLFSMMQVSSCDPEDKIPDMGLGGEWEMKLSSRFVIIGKEGSGYGTRCSTLLTVDREGHAEMEERTFSLSGGRVTGFESRKFKI